MPTRRALLKNLAIATTGIGFCSTLAPGVRGAPAAAGGGRKRRIAAIDIFPFTMHKIDPVLGGMEVKNGMVTLPDAPGLGVDVDPAFLKTLHAA